MGCDEVTVQLTRFKVYSRGQIKQIVVKQDAVDASLRSKAAPQAP
jgi:hypothetical protein